MKTGMIKFLASNRQKLTELFYCVLCILLIILLTACGDSYYSSSDKGSIAFSVEWSGTPTIQASQPSIKAASLDCAAAGVSTVEGNVYDENDSHLASGGPWDCEDHQGTITGVAAGSNRKVVILGKNSSGRVIYRGEKIGIIVVGGQKTDVGTITAVRIEGEWDSMIWDQDAWGE